MSPETLRSIGTHVLVAGIVVLWGTLAIRAPTARHSPPRRRMFIAIAGLAASITIFLEPVASWVNSTSDCGIMMNVWGVLSSALILDFVLAAISRRRPLLVYGAAAVVNVVLLLLNTSTCVTPESGPRFVLFCCLLCLAHVLGTAPSAILCARYARQAANRPLRAGLSVLATGFASSTVFWAFVAPGVLLTRDPWFAAVFVLNVGLTAWVMALGTALPQLLRLRRAVGDRRTLRRLEPLWRRLVTAVPHVHLPEPGHGRWASDLRLYRRVIEIRDAVLVLRDYAGPETIEAARAHVRGHDGDEAALATACWLPLAEAAKARGAAPRAFAAPADTGSGDDWAGEVAFARTLAEHQNSALVQDFTRATAQR